jgi:hypothetical protein
MDVKTIAACIIAVELTTREENFTYQRGCLREALEFLCDHDMPGAIHALGNAIDHAYRPDWTETRPEVAVCEEAFQVLTCGPRQKGGAA